MNSVAGVTMHWVHLRFRAAPRFLGFPRGSVASVPSIAPEARLFSAKWPFIEGYCAADNPDPRLVYAHRGPT